MVGVKDAAGGKGLGKNAERRSGGLALPRRTRQRGIGWGVEGKGKGGARRKWKGGRR